MKVEISHPEKLLFPDDGITKGDLAAYYEDVARWMLPHVRDRPVSMQRFPDGIAGKGFFHKDAPDYFPDWIARAELPKAGGTVTHVLIRNADTLRYLANQNTITPHVFTGSKGIHIWTPLRRRANTDEVRAFANDAAELLAEQHPDELTTEFRKAKRDGRILVDVARNGYAQTAVPPYAVRPRKAAPVATPITLDELSDARLRPDRWTLRNVLRRLGSKGDPWADIQAHARGLSAPRKRLAKLLR